MELSKKTTILFPPCLHEHLMGVAVRQRTSLGELVRRACEERYRSAASKRQPQAAEAIAAMGLPVSSPRRMKAESVPRPKRVRHVRRLPRA